MLIFVKNLIKKNISEYQLNIYLEEFELLGNEKAAATISTTHLMGSIEVLKDLTTDLLIVEFRSEDIIYSKTFEKINDNEELNNIIQQYLQEFDECENKYQNKE